jgi:hypothetical protein
MYLFLPVFQMVQFGQNLHLCQQVQLSRLEGPNKRTVASAKDELTITGCQSDQSSIILEPFDGVCSCFLKREQLSFFV